MATPRVGVVARRARLGVRHRLATGTACAASTAGAVGAAEAVIALHATDPATVVLSALARIDSGGVGTVEQALHDDRALVRMLAMRRTVWVVPAGDAPLVQAAASRDVAATQRRRLLEHLTRAAVASDAAAWLTQVEDATRAALERRGEATAAELVADVPELRTKIVLPPETVGQNATTRVLMLLAADGHIVRGRPLGSWTSTLYRWSPATAWWPGGMPELDAAQARVELARRWLISFGPAPVSDLQWWTGWTLGRTRAALAALDTVDVDLDGLPGVALASGLDDVLDGGPADPGPWVALLPALDPTPMGWQNRDWYLGEHRAPLFDRTGNIGPTVWCDGRIVGGWAHRPDGAVAVRLLEDIGTEATAAVAAEAERLAALIGDIRVVPRFRTPLERELAS